MPPPLSHVATLIAAEHLESGILSDACDRLREAGLNVAGTIWLDEGIAVDIGFSGDIDAASMALQPLQVQIDIAVQPASNRRKMLLVSDMDSTMITVECIDELADYAGIKPQIAAITERAMQGDLDFASALKERVALLAGLDNALVQTCLADRVRLMPGAQPLVRTMTGWGARAILVSGGFTAFAEPVSAMIGFDLYHANQLLIEQDRLTGQLAGAIVDAAAKRIILQDAAQDMGLDGAQIVAVGDGANDLPMIEVAMAGGGLGAAYHAKPVVAETANFAIRQGDLTALLYAQGVAAKYWVRQ